MTRPGRLLCAAVAIAAGQGLAAQAPGAAPAPQAFTLAGALDYAAQHYPAIRLALEQSNAAAAGIDVARSAYLPRLDAMWQANRATANNVFGQVLPQSVLPSLSGPVLPSASGQSVWGTAAGVLFSWEPVDFGARNAAVSGAEAGLAQARAGEALTRLDVERAAGFAFLDVVAAEATAGAAQADVDRRETLARVVHALVDSELRAGADASRADAERATASTRLLRARASLVVAQTVLARVLGAGGGVVAANADGLLDRLPESPATTMATTAHPLAQARQAAKDVAAAHEQVLARTDLPRVYLQSSVMARGSGANPNGTLDGGFDGLGFDRANWAAGVQVVFPNLFDMKSLHARQAAASAEERAESARYDEALLSLTAAREAAAAMLDAARSVASNTPAELAAAGANESQARARYQAGLVSLVEVADAQSLLALAEAEDRLARVDVWRALLAQAVASGDVSPFVALIRP